MTFDVQQGDQTQSATTSSGQNLARTEAMDLPEGEVMIAEQVPDGYQLAYIFCRFIERSVDLGDQPMMTIAQVQDGGASVESQTITDNGMQSAIRGGYVLVCVFIDIPVQQYEVTVYKYAVRSRHDARSAAGVLPGLPDQGHRSMRDRSRRCRRSR